MQCLKAGIGTGAEEVIGSAAQAGLANEVPVFVEERISMGGSFSGFDKSKMDALLSYLWPVDLQLVARNIDTLNSKIGSPGRISLTGEQQQKNNTYMKCDTLQWE